MKCTFCESTDTQVLESRTVDGGQEVRRRRECQLCGKRFTTYEKAKRASVWVIKKDDSREPWSREKVRRGIQRSIYKRPVSMETVEDIVGEVEVEILERGVSEIPSQEIGRAILKHLKKLDKVAWLRFASVYLEFEDLKDFEKAIEGKI